MISLPEPRREPKGFNTRSNHSEKSPETVLSFGLCSQQPSASCCTASTESLCTTDTVADLCDAGLRLNRSCHCTTVIKAALLETSLASLCFRAAASCPLRLALILTSPQTICRSAFTRLRRHQPRLMLFCVIDPGTSTPSGSMAAAPPAYHSSYPGGRRAGSCGRIPACEGEERRAHARPTGVPTHARPAHVSRSRSGL